MKELLVVVEALVGGLTGSVILNILGNVAQRRKLRRMDAEEAERILVGPARMEERTILDPSSKTIIMKQVPVGSPMLPYQQLRSADFNRLEERIKALEEKLRRTR